MTGLISTKSCSAPCGQTPAQKARPANNATTIGAKQKIKHRHRHRVIRVEQPVNDILRRADGADAAFAVKSKIGQGKERQPEKPAPRALFVNQPDRHAKRGEKHAGIDILQPELRGPAGVEAVGMR